MSGRSPGRRVVSPPARHASSRLTGRSWICAIALAAGACHQAPTAATVATVGSGAGPLTVIVTDGWSRAAVPNAHVTGEGIDTLTDTGGRTTVPVPAGCTPLTIDADGFLERRTCAASSITLWPVATEEEVVATHAAAFVDNARFRYYGSQMGVGLDPDLAARPDIVAVWSRAIQDLTRYPSSSERPFTC